MPTCGDSWRRRRAADLHDRIARLAELGANAATGGITREVFTPLYREALDLVAEWMREAGMAVRLDAFGNLFGRLEGREPHGPVVLTGSHVDTTLDAGRYDGVVGVVGAIEAVHLLDAEPRKPIEVVAVAGEEPRFGSGCIGSRALAGSLRTADLDRLADRDGVTLRDALAGFGLEPERFKEARLDPERVYAFVELHIEQGQVLEASGDEIGVVTAIAAPHDFRLTLRGAAAHAGATPMGMRRDALAGAAEAMTALERIVGESPSGTTVGTVGVLELEPGAINVVPGEVRLDVDVRDSDHDARTSVVLDFLSAAALIAERRGLELDVETIVDDLPVACDVEVIRAAEAACEELGVRARRMTSGAYHDAMIIGRELPAGMIFVPSAGGVSHHPDEYTAPEDLDRGVRVLAGTLARLAA